MTILVIGLDAAVRGQHFGWAIGEWTASRKPKVSLIDSGVLDRDNHVPERMAKALKHASKTLVAIDAPLGWPEPLSTNLSKHEAGAPLAQTANMLFRRCTDRHVREFVGKQTLDVGADRIARTAHSALSFLERLSKVAELQIPLAWNVRFAQKVAAIEVYPAGTLKAHGLAFEGYKADSGGPIRKRIANQLKQDIRGLSKLAAGRDDVFDAGLCLLAASDFLSELAVEPCEKDLPSAKKEGWIWVRRPAKRE